MNPQDKHPETTTPRAPRGPSLRSMLIGLAVAAGMLIVGVLFAEPIRSGMSKARSMMKTEDAPAPPAADEHDHTTLLQYYTCGMHPWIPPQTKPGLCPICQMALSPIDPAKFTGEVSINPVVVQNIGVRVEPVVTGPLVRTIRTVGSIEYDETVVRDVNIKIGGWIEKLHVDYLGAAVEEGQPLFDLYSPELYETQEQYLLAWRNRDKIKAEFIPDAARAAHDMLDAARTRLEFYDITPQQIKALEDSGKPSKTMTIRSPHTGVVVAKNANEGMKIDGGMQLYRIVDLSTVWVMVTLYEYQLPYVSLGQRAIMTLPYIPGHTFEGKVLYIYPFLESRTRQVRVRLEFDNADGLLKPGMYANIELKSTLAEDRTLVPRSAVIDTGERQIAFVSLGDGRFEPRDVQIGVETDDGQVQVLDGLRPGEMVVTSGQFLLDSEAKVREALAKMIKGTPAAEQKAVAAVGARSELDRLPQPAAQHLLDVLNRYVQIGDALARDTTVGIVEPARQLAQAMDSLIAVDIPSHPQFWHEHDEAATVRGKALELIDVSDLTAARLRYADLSIALASLTRATGVPPAFDRELQQLRCPMYREGQGGGVWLQPAGDVRNPFFGASMLRCFDERTTLPVTGAGSSAAPEDRP